jgi:Tol biopolymer transport system component
VLPLEGERKPFPVADTRFDEREGQFSPDGRFVAYESNESGKYEVYVQPFRSGEEKQQISTAGGAQPRWAHSGRELFYVALDGTLMAAPVKAKTDEKSFDFGPPVPLFSTRISGGAVPGGNKQQYVVAADGQRFLINVAAEVTSPITLVLHWKPPAER